MAPAILTPQSDRNRPDAAGVAADGGHEEDSTEVKLALLASLSGCDDSDVLFEALLANDGNVDKAAELLDDGAKKHSEEVNPKKRKASTFGYQASLSSFRIGDQGPSPKKQLTRKGKTLHLYSPEDIAAHTPCSIIHNFLDKDQADGLLLELLGEAPSFNKETFKVFDNVVTSPHTMCFYVDDWDEAQRQKNDYIYNGTKIHDIRTTPSEMRKVASIVQAAVNREIQTRIRTHYPDQKKLKYQSPGEWIPNTAFANCYDGGKESVGYHSDQLTYLGPRAVIGSLSLGVAREFRVRKIVPRNTTFELADKLAKTANDERADVEGQIAIHLPHNSLLVMHAEMQEEWKHSIAPAQAIDPHPVAGGKRINVTYRHYRETFHPSKTPRCKCGVPTVLRCVQKQEQNRGRYMWQCHASLGQSSCNFFEWAKVDDDGEPPWAMKEHSH